ncbi:MAG: hypothetical protein KF901_25960, partial [Myxococcales bacterium]|nr:hypothetical protein [Myxococcales bacterium]
GTISKLEQEASDALAPVYTEALDAARASEAAFVDETSWTAPDGHEVPGGERVPNAGRCRDERRSARGGLMKLAGR